MPSKGSGRLPLGALAVGAVGLAFLACLGTFWFLRDRREFAEVKRLLLEIERQPAEAKGAEIERARSLLRWRSTKFATVGLLSRNSTKMRSSLQRRR